MRRATVYFSGLGLSEVYLNGRKVGDHVLSPGMTQYPKRVFYVTHEVANRVRTGKNAIGVVLGNGRYYSPRSQVYAGMPHYGFPKLLLHLRLEYDDGTTSTVVSDESWRLTADGPILANNEYDTTAQPPLGDYTGIAFNAAGVMRSETTAESIFGTPEFQCRPHSAPHQWRGLGGARILKEQDPLVQV